MVRGFAVQFNWIFVLIAGALILAFFFSVAMKQRSLSDERLSITLSSDLENVLTSAVVAKGTAQSLPVPSKGLSFACSSGCDCRFSVGRASKSFSDLIIFAPDLLERDGVVWSLDWNVPYRVTNFLLVASNDVGYYFVSDGGSESERLLGLVKRRLPPQIRYVVVHDVGEIEDEGYADVRFIFLGDAVSVPDFMRRVDGSAVSVSGGLLSFYEKDGLEWSRTRVLPFPGFELFLASIFSADDVMFECDLRSAFSRAAYVADVMSGRAASLQRLSGGSCYYQGAVRALSDQSDAAVSLASSFSASELSVFNNLASQVDQLNRQLVQKSCRGLF